MGSYEVKHPAADAYLRRYKDALRESKYLEEHIAFLRAQATGLQRQLDGMPRGSPSKDRIAAIVSGVVDEEMAIIEKLAQVHEVRREVMKCIECVPNERARRVLFMDYIQVLPVEEIAEHIDRDCKAVYRDRRNALAYIEEHCAGVLQAAA